MKLLIISMIKANSTVQIVRYVVLGISMNLIGYGLYLMMTWFGIDPKVAMTIGYAIGLAVSFLGNKKWTFSHEGQLSITAYRFLLMHLSGYLFNLGCLYVFVDIYEKPHYIVQLSAMGILAVYFFIMLKFFVFVSKPLGQQE